MKEEKDESDDSDMDIPSPDQGYGQNYIYKPTGDEVKVHYSAEEFRKRKFINIEEEAKHQERKIMAKSFIERGYGVT